MFLFQDSVIVVETVQLNTIRKKPVFRLEYRMKPSQKSSSSILHGQIKWCASCRQEKYNLSKDPRKKIMWIPALQSSCCTLLSGLLFPALAGFSYPGMLAHDNELTSLFYCADSCSEVSMIWDSRKFIFLRENR